MIGIIMDFNVVLWGNRLRAVSARPYKALDKSRSFYPTMNREDPVFLLSECRCLCFCQ